MIEYGIIHDSGELRKLIAENPDLPIVVLASEEAACPDYCWTYCNDVRCDLSMLLDVETPYDADDGYLFTDKGEFEEAIADTFSDDEKYHALSDQEFDEAVKREMDKYECHWKRVIVIYASN